MREGLHNPTTGAPCRRTSPSTATTDSLPVVMPDGAFALDRHHRQQFDLRVRRSSDGLAREPRIITAAGERRAPHQLVGDSPDVIELCGAAPPVGQNSFRIVRDPAVVHLDAVFADGFGTLLRRRGFDRSRECRGQAMNRWILAVSSCCRPHRPQPTSPSRRWPRRRATGGPAMPAKAESGRLHGIQPAALGDRLGVVADAVTPTGASWSRQADRTGGRATHRRRAAHVGEPRAQRWRNPAGLPVVHERGNRTLAGPQREWATVPVRLADRVGWSMVAERDARVVAVGGQRLAMLYRRPIAEGDLPAGLYFAGSTDAGVAWDHARTLVAADALGLDRPAFAVRAADDRHLAAYTVDSGAGSRTLLVRTTLDAADWSAAPLAVSAAGDHLDPDLSVLADGSFLLVWARGDGAGGHDLVARRSSDGSTWSPKSPWSKAMARCSIAVRARSRFARPSTCIGHASPAPIRWRRPA